jgi:hypothetical protein
MIRKLSLVILLVSAASAASETPALSTFSHNGYQVDVQTVGGITVQATLVDVGDADRVDVRVLNKTDKIVEIQPESISLSAISPKDADLKLLSDKELRKNASRQSLFSNLLIGFTSEFDTNPSLLTSPAFATTAALRMPEDDGHTEASRLQRKPEMADKAVGIDQLLLRHTIIFPNQSTIGSVFFKRTGKLGGAVVYVWLGRNIFSLPFGSATPTSLVARVHPSIDEAPTTPALAIVPTVSTPSSSHFSRTAVQSPHPDDETFAVLGVRGTIDNNGEFRITDVTPYSVAAKAGLHPIDDWIIAVNGRPVRTVDDLNSVLSANRSTAISITVMHQYWREEKVITLP